MVIPRLRSHTLGGVLVCAAIFLGAGSAHAQALPAAPPVLLPYVAGAATSPQATETIITRVRGVAYLPLICNGCAKSPDAPLPPGQGGTVTLGTVTVIVPPGALSRPTTFHAVVADAPPPEVMSSAGVAVNLTAIDDSGTPVTSFAKAVTVRIAYRATELTAIDAAQLSIYTQTGGPSWTKLPSRVDVPESWVQAQTTHLSLFALFAPPLVSPPSGGNTLDATIMAVGSDSALYYMREARPEYLYAGDLYRIAAGAAVTDYSLIDLGHMGLPWPPPNWPTWTNVEAASSANTLFVRRAGVVHLATLGATVTSRRLYPPTTDSACAAVSRVRYDRYSGTLWVACHGGGNHSLRQIDAASGALLQSLPLPFGQSENEDFAVDSLGRLFATAPVQNFSMLSSSGWTGALVVWEPGTQRWKLVAEGFKGRWDGDYGQPLAVDNAGHLFVANLEPGILSVFGGSSPQVIGAAKLGVPAVSLAWGSNRLVVSTGTSFISLAGTFWQEVNVPAEMKLQPTGSVSGKGSTVVLAGALPLLPAHASAQLGSARLPLYKVEGSQWRFGPFTLSAQGSVRVQVGSGALDGGALGLPEMGNWRRYDYKRGVNWQCTNTPQVMNVGEWIVWEEGATLDNSVSTVHSNQGLFPDWNATQGPWLAYQLASAGDFTFVVDGQSCPVSVRHAGREVDSSAFQVDPAVGGVFYSNGSRMEIPAGALPGTAPYWLSLNTAGNDADGNRIRAFEFVPEPPRLNQVIRFSARFNPALPLPGPLYADTGESYAGPQVAAPWPIRSEREVSVGWSTVVLGAGEYAGATTLAPEWHPSAAQPAEVAATSASLFSGFDIFAKLNSIGKSVRWQLGLPNRRIMDATLHVVYDIDKTTEEKAFAVYGALTQARTRFKNLGFASPGWVIAYLDRDFAQEGRSDSVRRLLNWQITLGAWQDKDDLSSAAVHEYFHIVQYHNMSYAAWVDKLLNPWVMEGTAVWAEMQVTPDSNSAPDFVRRGADFVHTGMRNWGSLSETQAYATVAFFHYMEAEKPGTILALFQTWQRIASPSYAYPVDALEAATGGLGPLYTGFVQEMFAKQNEPYKSWDTRKAYGQPVTFDQAVEILWNENLPPYTTRAVTVTAAAGPAVGILFTDFNGSVLRVEQGITPARTWAWVPGQATPLVQAGNGTGLRLPQASTFTTAQPLRVVHANGSAYVDPVKVILEVPVVHTVLPSAFYVAEQQTFQIGGDGFGPAAGTVVVGGSSGAPVSWSIVGATRTITANTLGKGALTVQVIHKAGVTSNTRTVTGY